MVGTVGSVTLLIALSSTGGIFFNRNPNNLVLPPQPAGFGPGFANGSPDGYGWADHGVFMPLTADRTPDYHFPRYLVVPPSQMFFPQYDNPYVSRGQRFLPFTGCGGPHPASTTPAPSAMLPVHPYNETLNTQPRIAVPNFNGRVEAQPVNPGTTGLRP